MRCTDLDKCVRSLIQLHKFVGNQERVTNEGKGSLSACEPETRLKKEGRRLMSPSPPGAAVRSVISLRAEISRVALILDAPSSVGHADPD